MNQMTKQAMSIFTYACFSFVVLNEEADGNRLQHEEQRLAPSTRSEFSIIYWVKLWGGKKQVWLLKIEAIYFVLLSDQPERKFVGYAVGHGSWDGQQLQQHSIKTESLGALGSHQLHNLR